MKASEYTKEQLIVLMHETGWRQGRDFWRKYRMSEATYYNQEAEYAALAVPES